MATDLKISQLNNGNPAQSADELVINRSGVDFSVTAGSVAALVPPPAPVDLLVNIRSWKAITNSGSLGDVIGLAPNAIFNTSALINPTATQTNFNSYSTSASVGNQASIAMTGVTGFGINPNNAQLWSTQTLKAVKWQIIQVTQTNFRTWIGLADLYVGNIGNMKSDTPAQNIIGFRFSTAAGDTHWQAVCANGVTQTTVDTGVALDALQHTFGINVTQSSIKFTIDGVTVATITTNIPANTVRFGDIMSLDNVGTANVATFAFSGFASAE